MSPIPKITEVGCAVIHYRGQILIAQRRLDDNLGGYWEFPGGSREIHESIEDCLIREVKEELGVDVLPGKFLKTIEHHRPDRILRLQFYLCEWKNGHPCKLECHDFQWVYPEQLRAFRFPPADHEMIMELIWKSSEYFGNFEKE